MTVMKMDEDEVEKSILATYLKREVILLSCPARLLDKKKEETLVRISSPFLSLFFSPDA